MSIMPNVKAPANNEFLITMLKGSRKTDTMKFSTDHRADVLTEALVSKQFGKSPLLHCYFNVLFSSAICLDNNNPECQ